MPTSSSPLVSENSFGNLKDGRPTKLYTLQNKHGVTASITNYGATLVSLKCPDNNGKVEDIIFGFDDIDGYVNSDAFHGATVGRFANRIANGTFSLDGETFSLAKNGGPNHLHGGTDGFDKRIWHAEILKNDDAAVRFTLFSPDGDQGYPGNVTIHLVYRLNADGRLSMEIDATADKATPISITHHSYFNLAGQGSVLEHELTLDAEQYTPLNDKQVPTGEFASVENTPFDFRKAKTLGKHINNDHPQLTIAKGYDHNFVTKATNAKPATLVATLYEPNSGRELKVSTTAPGVQVYTANFLDNVTQGKGVLHAERHAVCIEPQHFPDAPNQANFPDCILRPGKKYHHTMTFELGTR